MSEDAPTSTLAETPPHEGAHDDLDRQMADRLKAKYALGSSTEDYPFLLDLGQPTENLRRYITLAELESQRNANAADGYRRGDSPARIEVKNLLAEIQLADRMTFLALCAGELQPQQAQLTDNYKGRGVETLLVSKVTNMSTPQEEWRLKRKVNQAAIDKIKQEVPLLAALERTAPPVAHEVVDKQAIALAQMALRAESATRWGTDPDTQPQGSQQRHEFQRKIHSLDIDPPTKRETLAQSAKAKQQEHRQHILQRLYETSFPELAQTADLVSEEPEDKTWRRVLLVRKDPDTPIVFHGTSFENDIDLNNVRDRSSLFEALAPQGPDEQFRANVILDVLFHGIGDKDDLIYSYADASIYSHDGTIASPGRWMLQKALYAAPEERRRTITELVAPALNVTQNKIGGPIPGSDTVVAADAWRGDKTSRQAHTEIHKESLPDTKPFLSYKRNTRLAGRMLTALPTDPERPYPHVMPSANTDQSLEATEGWARLKGRFEGYDLTIPGYTALNPTGEDGVYAREASFDPYDIRKLTLPADRAARIAAQLTEGGAEHAGRVLSAYAQRHEGQLPLGALIEALREHTTYEAGYRWLDGQSQPDLSELESYGVTDGEGKIAGNCTVSAAILSRCLTLAGYEDVEIVSGYLMDSASVSLDISHVQVSFAAPDGKRYFADATASQAPPAEGAADAQPTHVQLPEYRDSTAQAAPVAHPQEIQLTKHEVAQKAEICNRLENETLAAIDALYMGEKGEEPLQKAIRLKLAPQDNQLLTLFRLSKQWSSSSTSGNIEGRLEHIQELCATAEKIQQGSGTAEQRIALTRMFGPAAAELGTVEVVRALASKYKKEFAKLGI